MSRREMRDRFTKWRRHAGSPFLAVPVLLAACSTAQPPTEATNLLLIVSDTLRADAVRCTDDTVSTPNLCGLADRGVFFENAYSHAPATLQSSVAMFTGNHAFTYSRLEKPPRGGYDWIHVPDEERLLAECLAESDYDTPAFVQNGLAAAANGMQGFRILGRGHIESIDLAPLESRLGLDLSIRGTHGVAGTIDYLFDAPESFYLVQWMTDPHAVYDPPAKFLDDLKVDAERLPRPIEYYRGLGHFNRPNRGLRRLDRQATSLSDDEREFLHRLYEKEVEWVDERVGYFLEALEAAGLRDSTVVAFTSDHGEGFGEHGKFLHGFSLHEEMVRVPLILAGPGIPRGRRINARVSLVDLTPTLADLIGADCPLDARGVSLVPLLNAAEAPPPKLVYLSNPGRQPSDSLVHGRWKLIADTDTGAVELYDLVADPEERTNLAARHADVVERMGRYLAEITSADRLRREHVLLAADEAALEETKEETLRQLEALGYLD